ncbi:tRNA (adenine(22)-N(1))-methyltransferase [Candidatus Epulonipiscium viviparus]|uniref:tRNA (adenine(22)-N(1))-methyltransferase n=1 Tax=Candidatus Epulonipiscium viviparus TaxID=420336 RepID=UPI00016C0A4E|nr:class I SAM-dependent methyltransferase [Candidatus Epulopiscium viviparus]
MTKRLLEIANAVNKGARVADIGTDHGLVPKYLIENDIASFVLACDINLGPLQRARQYIGDTKNIEIRQSNGLSNIKMEDNIDTVIIAGMGGHLIKEILSRDFNTIKFINRLILSPQNAQNNIRKFLHSIDFKIVDEIFIKDMSKFYVIIIAERGVQSYTNEYEYEYGFLNIKTLNMDFREFISQKQSAIINILKQLEPNTTRYNELQNELEVLKCIQ